MSDYVEFISEKIDNKPNRRFHSTREFSEQLQELCFSVGGRRNDDDESPENNSGSKWGMLSSETEEGEEMWKETQTLLSSRKDCEHCVELFELMAIASVFYRRSDHDTFIFKRSHFDPQL